MDTARRAAWVRRLHPLVIDEPIEPQVRRQFLIRVVGSALVLGILGFIFTLFAAFGRWDIGLRIVLPLVLVLAWFWLLYIRLRRRVAAYRHAVAADPAPN